MEGDRIKRPRLAETLKLIAINGPDIFYNGNMTDNLVKEIRAFKGIIKREDFVNYKVKWRKPIKSTIGNLTVYTAPPPGSGALLTFIKCSLRYYSKSGQQNYMAEYNRDV